MNSATWTIESLTSSPEDLYHVIQPHDSPLHDPCGFPRICISFSPRMMSLLTPYYGPIIQDTFYIHANFRARKPVRARIRDVSVRIRGLTPTLAEELVEYRIMNLPANTSTISVSRRKLNYSRIKVRRQRKNTDLEWRKEK